METIHLILSLCVVGLATVNLLQANESRRQWRDHGARLSCLERAAAKPITVQDNRAREVATKVRAVLNREVL